jgi:hypothetical protein
MLSSDFEQVAGITKSQVERKGKTIAAFDKFSDETVEIPARLKEVAEAMYKV